MDRKIHIVTAPFTVGKVVPVMTKKCSKCKEIKLMNDFSPKKDMRKDGKHPYCKKCRALYERERYHTRKL
jgi:hypothetical protein